MMFLLMPYAYLFFKLGEQHATIKMLEESQRKMFEDWRFNIERPDIK